RKDVEMVLRIRDLLYEEKFTIAGAKKRLMEETRGASSRHKSMRETPESVEPIEPADIESDSTDTTYTLASDAPSTPEARLAINVLKRNLEDLLTMLKSDASISR
ncbi:MAG TPA: hypothetical protein VLD57_01325, partial [Blastocatellia bacterium]|nr:hypothetical protein [Blastocatellia bacterium]